MWLETGGIVRLIRLWLPVSIVRLVLTVLLDSRVIDLGNHGSDGVVPREKEAYRERPETDRFFGRIDLRSTVCSVMCAAFCGKARLLNLW